MEILVGLCGTCHKWAHANPKAAKVHGYIIAPFETDPASIPIKTFMGWVTFSEDGGVTVMEENWRGN